MSLLEEMREKYKNNFDVIVCDIYDGRVEGDHVEIIFYDVNIKLELGGKTFEFETSKNKTVESKQNLWYVVDIERSFDQLYINRGFKCHLAALKEGLKLRSDEAAEFRDNIAKTAKYLQSSISL